MPLQRESIAFSDREDLLDFLRRDVGQWLDLRKINATIPDPHLYGDFDGTLLWAMPRETHLFFEEVLKGDRISFRESDTDKAGSLIDDVRLVPG